MKFLVAPLNGGKTIMGCGVQTGRCGVQTGRLGCGVQSGRM